MVERQGRTSGEIMGDFNSKAESALNKVLDIENLSQDESIAVFNTLVDSLSTTYEQAVKENQLEAVEDLLDLEKTLKNVISGSSLDQDIKDYFFSLLTVKKARDLFSDNNSQFQSELVSNSYTKLEEISGRVGVASMSGQVKDLKTIIDQENLTTHIENQDQFKLFEGRSLLEVLNDKEVVDWEELNKISNPTAKIGEIQTAVYDAAASVTDYVGSDEVPLTDDQLEALAIAQRALLQNIGVFSGNQEYVRQFKNIYTVVHSILHESKAIEINREETKRHLLRPSSKKTKNLIYGESQMFRGTIGEANLARAERIGLSIAKDNKEITEDDEKFLRDLKTRFLTQKTSLLGIYIDAGPTVSDDDLDKAVLLVDEIDRYIDWVDDILKDAEIESDAVSITSETREIGKRPTGNADQSEWERFYEENADLEFFTEEFKYLKGEIFGFPTRIQSHDKEPGQFLKRILAFEKIAAQQAETLNEPELFYMATLIEKIRMVHDIDLVHSVTRALISNADGASAERGTVGFSLEKYTDWFLIPYKNTVGPDQKIQLYQPRDTTLTTNQADMYKYQLQVDRAFQLMEGVLLTDLAGGKFKEDDTGTNQVTSLLTEKLALENPDLDSDQINEIVNISVMLFSIGQGRLDTYADSFSIGGSPVQKISETLDYLVQCDPMSAAFYSAYKAKPFHEVEAINIHHWLHDRERQIKAQNASKPISLKEKMNKLENVHHMAYGAELELAAFAPLRKRRELRMRPPSTVGNVSMIEPIYPTALDTMWRKAEQRLKTQTTFENWASVRPKFQDYWTTCWGTVPKPPESGDDRNQKYRHELAEALHKLLTSKISGLKSNMMVDWDFVADATVVFIDKLYRAYKLVDKSEVGRRAFWELLMRKIHEEDQGNLSSAGNVQWYLGSFKLNPVPALRPMFLREGIEIIENGKKVIKNEVKPGDLVSMRSYLLLQQSDLIKYNYLRRDPAIQGDIDHPEVAAGVSILRDPVNYAKWQKFKATERDFPHAFHPMGRAKEEQKKVPQAEEK